MNNIEICLTPKLFQQYTVDDKIVVIVDILRATTIITTLFHNGLNKLIPVKSLDEAKEYKKNGFLVAAERNGKKVDFADFGNSPFEFTTDKIKDKTLVYSSTNGTNTINIAKQAEQVIIASFLNLSSVSEFLEKQDKDILILCSGWMGDFCTEDFLFAGALSTLLMNTNKFSFNSDSVQVSIDLWNMANQNLSDYIKTIHQYKRLVDFGFQEIVKYCFKIDITKVIPVLDNDYLVELQ
ncbi:MAG: 2-phosphosulfolactate phosphatase [Bacteroidetes bacterium]|nr:2-phosphosulfolactate phosphatase [Bacteroidota bacterium]